MIRGDVLRAKSTQVSVEHKRELVALGRAREREDRARVSADASRDRFWREVTKATVSGRGGSAEVGLNRAREAGRLFRIAQHQHHQAEQKVIAHVARALKADVSVKKFESLERKEARRLARQNEEVLAEEVGEVAILHARDAKSLPVCGLPGAHEVGRRFNDAPVAQRADDVRVEPPLAVDGIVIRDVEAHAVRDLRLSCESSGQKFSCRVQEDDRGRVAIAVESSHSEICSRALSARLALTTRLRSLGIDLHAVKVSNAAPAGGALDRPLRYKRPRREEDDESVIS